MFDVREYYKKENDGAQEHYQSVLLNIKNIVAATEGSDHRGVKAPFMEYFNQAGRFILDLAEFEKRINHAYFENADFEALKAENRRLFAEITPERYSRSYADPCYAVSRLGDHFGQALSYFYVRVRRSIQFAFQHKIFRIAELGNTFVDLFDLIRDMGPVYEAVRAKVIEEPQNPKARDVKHELQENFSVDFGYFTDIVRASESGDLRYLFSYGRSISDAEIESARFIRQYPEEKIRSLSGQIAKSYATGFRRDNKDLSRKSTVRIFYAAGYERVIRRLMDDMLDLGLQSVVGSIFSHKPNRQYEQDHKFDAALYLDDGYVTRAGHAFSDAYEQMERELAAYSGSVLLETFGEKPFVPDSKSAALRFSSEHHRLTQAYQNRRTEIVEKYMPRTETSFTIISFPSPEIGCGFRDIFDGVYTVNTLDAGKYERIQQSIIDELDKAEYVHVKGKDGSETDIKVKMHPLVDPSKQTNFMNCGADVNIPLGEVFTSPMLKGTSGVLHVEETFLNGLRYDNLKLIFEDGYISEYSCNNYERDEDNKKYIEENLLFPHKTLPVGEFAIGTNTLAYAMSKKYDILKVLPILIIEKMGPHFAVGDTCYRHTEDLPAYNDLDGKEIIARENEKSALRKEKPDEAYTYCHTDITIPYESIDFIAAITKDGSRIDIIRDGRFVLEGTRELNVPLNNL
jgi:aminopeptidase